MGIFGPIGQENEPIDKKPRNPGKFLGGLFTTPIGVETEQTEPPTRGGGLLDGVKGALTNQIGQQDETGPSRPKRQGSNLIRSAVGMVQQNIGEEGELVVGLTGVRQAARRAAGGALGMAQAQIGEDDPQYQPGPSFGQRFKDWREAPKKRRELKRAIKQERFRQRAEKIERASDLVVGTTAVVTSVVMPELGVPMMAVDGVRRVLRDLFRKKISPEDAVDQVTGQAMNVYGFRQEQLRQERAATATAARTRAEAARQAWEDDLRERQVAAEERTAEAQSRQAEVNSRGGKPRKRGRN